MSGNNPDYDELLSSSNNAYTITNGAAIDISGYVFDLFKADVSINVDPSYAVATFVADTFADVDAIALFDVSVSAFNNLFFITVDSSDIDDASANDIVFSIDPSFENPFVPDGVSMEFSSADVIHGAVNYRYTDQVLKKDVVRHLAKEITGGYAVADIFSNEEELINDVVGRDAEIHTQLDTAISTIVNDVTNGRRGRTIDQFDDAALSEDEKRFYKVAHTLFGLSINDPGGRQEQIYKDLSDASVDASGNPNVGQTTTTIPLRFIVGDAIALRISYDPKSSPVGGGNAAGGGMGDNPISNRSYKLILRLVA